MILFVQNIIDRAFRGGPPNQVLADKFSIQITRRDIHTLAGLNWLNDEVSYGISLFILIHFVLVLSNKSSLEISKSPMFKLYLYFKFLCIKT